MRKLIIFLFVVLLSPHVGTFAQSLSDSLELIRQNPHGWFALQLPRDIRRLDGPVDVDGGRYESDALKIHFDYWTHQNTPNWLRGNYASSLVLACSGENGLSHTRQTWIDGKRAVVQQCSLKDARKGFRYIYYVTFPKVRIFDGEKFRDGMFNLAVEYKHERYSSLAKRIVGSLDFEVNGSLAMVSQSAIGDQAVANNQGPSLDQLRTEYAMRFLEPAPHMALAKYFSDHGNRLQAFFILETARRGRFKEEEFDEAFAQMFRGRKTHDHSLAAEAALTTEHDRDPNSTDTVVKLADIYVHRKDWTKAKEYISKAIRLRPEDFENTEALATVLRLEGKQEEADRLFSDYAHRYPKTLHGYQLRIAEVIEKQHGKAKLLLSEAIKQFPQEGGFVFYLGTILQREGKLPEAEDHFVRAAGMSPDSVLIQAWVGRFFYKVKKDDRRALDYYLNAYLLDPHAYETEFVESRIPKINEVLARADYERQVKSGVPIAKILKNTNAGVVHNALEQMRLKWEPAYLKLLLDLMANDDGGVRWQATMIIKEKVNSSFDGTLKALLEDKDLRKRGLAAYIAVSRWKQASFDIIRSMLREESQLLRFDAVSALTLEGAPHGREILSEHLTVETNPQLKVMIERAITREACKP